jgi:hypothetical protein
MLIHRVAGVTPFGPRISRTMIAMTMAMTPSVKASNASA